MSDLTKPCKRWGGQHRKSDGRPLIGRRYAYRELWIQKRGPLGSKVLHHLCHQKWCVELDHLEPKPQGEHLLDHNPAGDWGQADKSHCPSGHAYSEENTYRYVRKDGRNERHCRKCVQINKRAYRARLKEKRS